MNLSLENSHALALVIDHPHPTFQNPNHLPQAYLQDNPIDMSNQPKIAACILYAYMSGRRQKEVSLI